MKYKPRHVAHCHTTTYTVSVTEMLIAVVLRGKTLKE
jgi:hypothetical protein